MEHLLNNGIVGPGQPVRARPKSTRKVHSNAMENMNEKPLNTYTDDELGNEITALDQRLKALKTERSRRFYEANPLPAHPVSQVTNTHGGVRGLSDVVPHGYRSIGGRRL